MLKIFLVFIGLCASSSVLKEFFNKKQAGVVNNAPVIGILSLPLHPYESWNVTGTTYIASSYVKFLEMGGARVVPIRIDHSYSEFDYLFDRLNGILFTGGDANIWANNSVNPILSSDYGAKGCYLYNKVKQSNDNGKFFPLWATCLGFELIHVCANNEFDTLGNFNGEPSYAQVNKFTAAANTSKLFTELSSSWGTEVISILSSKNASLLSHSHGISPSSYSKFPKLSSTFNILSTMNDKSGSPFVGIVEAKNDPIFGTQFHPEKNIYEWNQDVIPHFYEAVYTTTYFANFFVSQARKNSNQFQASALTTSLIYNYPPTFINSYFETISTFS